jgi:hypothetical protein
MNCQDRYGPNVPPTRAAITLADFDALSIGTFLSMLAERHSDAEILAMLAPKKIRAALKVVRSAAKAQEEK